MAESNMKKFIRHKYHAKPTKIDNIRFDSKKEANYYGQLKILRESGHIIFFLRQVPFHLVGNTTYRLDFMEFWANGDIKYTDIKGRDTPMSKLKRKQVEASYPIKIEVK